MALLEENPQLRRNATGFMAEIPRHEVDVDPFYLMVTEVTNEQYEVYVRAAGVRPPLLWGEEAIKAAREAYFKEQGEAIRDARESGDTPPIAVKFDEDEWWNENWRTSEWEVTDALAALPVVYVDYQDACGYAAWAGLRLVDENEFERAVRGDTDRDFPWNGAWRAGVAATNQIRGQSYISPVGSFPGGASVESVFDLAGNVWEWTASRFVSYPGWSHEKYTYGEGRYKETIDNIPPWNPDHRVVKGGSQQNSHFYARCTTRGGFDCYQRASALGFRCAASIRPRVDRARACLDEIPQEIRPTTDEGPVHYEPRAADAVDRWSWRDGTANVPNYAVITEYEYAIFVPVAELPAGVLEEPLETRLGSELVHLGILSTSEALLEPELPAGTYLVALRGKGPRSERQVESDGTEESRRPSVDELATLDPRLYNLVLIDMTGAPAATIPVERLDWATPFCSRLKLIEKTVLVPAEGEEEAVNPRRVEETQRWLDLEVFVEGRSRMGVKLQASVRIPVGFLADGGWR